MTTGPEGVRLDVVVPTLDEADHLPTLLADLRGLDLSHRVWVVDGGSTDGTAGVARRLGATVLHAPRGRASQLDRGARAGEAPWLFFVHADSHLPPFSARVLEAWLEDAGPHDAAYFEFALRGQEWFWRFIEVGQRLREEISGLVYGDQGLLVSRQVYRATGGFPRQRLMEDVAMMDRVRRHARVERLRAPLVTSPRRYEKEGRWRVWLGNTALISLYRLGVDAERLARWYPDGEDSSKGAKRAASSAKGARGSHPSGSSPGDPAPGHPGVPETDRRQRMLLVFAKAPRPGHVKTRLAVDVGHREAARIYRELGREVVDAVRPGPWRTVVAYAPRGAGREVADWLGRRDVEYWVQEGDDLGERMERAFDRAFGSASRVCVVGTDAPSVDGSVVAEAFRALDDADVVVGPARDGGYYLLALARPLPRLFRDIPWSTEAVLATTLDRVRAAGLSHHLLTPLTDVDTLADLRAEGR